MKKVMIITKFKNVADFHKMVLKHLFKDVEVSTLAFDKDLIQEEIDSDVLLISLYSIYVGIKELIHDRTKVIILSTTLTKEQFNRVKRLPPATKVLLVNYSPEMALESLALFRQIGLTEYDFIPAYPGNHNIPRLPTAVTLGEADKVPQFVDEIIDIGHRTLDIQTITDLAVELGMEDLLQSEALVNHFRNLCTVSNAVSALLDRANIIEGRFFKLLNVIDEGIIVTDPQGIVFAMNNKAYEILEINSNSEGKYLLDFFNTEAVEKAISSNNIVAHELTCFNNTNIVFRSAPVITAGAVTSILMIINRFEEKEKSQHKLRTKILGKGHKAKYFFSHIIGESEEINKVRNIANKMAKSDSSILITGETGTGKELFSQAIHNASRRKEYQFVAVNCAAIPEQLLESELFGYEEGAFTGAKKGGRIGLFELAHKGTLFLDEIGEMPIQLQSRLLRVIQEREVMRIGGDAIIHVDVRIIAATNKNLKKLIKENKFRADLYYRINVLSLKIPPLRERAGDILTIFKHLKNQASQTFVLTNEAKNYLLQYQWEGNFRELQNCVEYLAYLEKEKIAVEDLKEILSDDDIEDNEEMKISNISNYDFVLSCLYQSRRNLKGIGRRGILDMAKSKRIYITEGEIRKILQQFEEKGWVQVGKGRSGTFLSDKGIQAFRDRQENIFLQ